MSCYGYSGIHYECTQESEYIPEFFGPSLVTQFSVPDMTQPPFYLNTVT